MHRPLILLTATFAVAAGTAGTTDPPPKAETLYFPTTVGAKSTYKSEDGEYDLEVTNVTRVEGKVLVTQADVTPETMYKLRRKVEVSDRGLRLLENGFVGVMQEKHALSPPYWLLKLPATAGEQWEGKHQGGYPLTFTTGKAERVKVPAGEYDAVPVDLVMDWGSGRTTLNRHWYAPGVGPVKWTTLDGGEVVLKSFSPGKK